jgi:hypothetical protein
MEAETNGNPPLQFSDALLRGTFQKRIWKSRKVRSMLIPRQRRVIVPCLMSLLVVLAIVNFLAEEE